MINISKKLMILGVLLGIFLIPFHVNAEPFTLCDGFFYEDVPEDVKFEENAYVRPGDLRLLHVQYIGFDGEVHEGKLVVAYEATNPETGEVVYPAKEVLAIFKELFDAKYPIDTMSCFNFRNIAGTDRLSWHAFGLAVDINYSQNPCLIIGESGEIVSTIPENLEKYADRTLDEKGMIKIDDPCHRAFVSRDWEWGGSWETPIDYMHFQRFPWYFRRPAAKY